MPSSRFISRTLFAVLSQQYEPVRSCSGTQTLKLRAGSRCTRARAKRMRRVVQAIIVGVKRGVSVQYVIRMSSRIAISLQSGGYWRVSSTNTTCEIAGVRHSCYPGARADPEAGGEGGHLAAPSDPAGRSWKSSTHPRLFVARVRLGSKADRAQWPICTADQVAPLLRDAAKYRCDTGHGRLASRLEPGSACQSS